MSVSYSDVSDPVLAGIAANLQGEALWAMVYDACATPDLRTLQALRAAGRFRLESRDLEVAEHSVRPATAAHAPPVVNALAGLFQNREDKTHFFEERVNAQTEPGRVAVRTLNCCLDESVKRFVSALGHEILQDADRIAEAEYIEGPDDPLEHGLRGCRGMVAALACFMNDETLLRKSAESDMGMAMNVELRCGWMFPDGFSNARVHPSAVALVMGSLDCLKACGEFDSSRLHRMGMGPPSAGRQDVSEWTPFSVFRRNLHVSRPMPEVLDVLLKTMRGTDGTYTPHVQASLCKELMEWVRDGGRYLMPVLLDNRIFKTDRPTAISAAFENAFPEIAQQVLQEFGDVLLPPLPHNSGAVGWFPQLHPVRRLTGRPETSVWDRDETLALVVRAMADRGQVADLLEARDRDGRSLANLLVLQKGTAAIGALLTHGLDPMQPALEAPTLLQLAQLQHRDDLVHLFRVAAAKRTALDVLHEIEHCRPAAAGERP